MISKQSAAYDININKLNEVGSEEEGKLLVFCEILIIGL